MSWPTEKHSTPKTGNPLTAFARTVRRELILVGLAVVATVALAPIASEAHPGNVATQEFLDRVASATATALQTGDLAAADLASAGLHGGTTTLDDGSVATVLVGSHEGRCYLVHWQTPGIVGPRAGVLDPGLPCAASADVLATLPTPPLIEFFPGTVPPLEAASLLSPVGAPIHTRLQPFPAERTPAWFLPVMAALVTVILWQSVSIVLAALRYRPLRAVVRRSSMRIPAGRRS